MGPHAKVYSPPRAARRPKFAYGAPLARRLPVSCRFGGVFPADASYFRFSLSNGQHPADVLPPSPGHVPRSVGHSSMRRRERWMWRRGGARRGPRGPAAVPPPPQSHLGRFVGHAALATTPGAGKRRASAKRGETPYTGAAQILQRRGRVAVLCPLQLHRRGFHLHRRCLRTQVVAAAADTAPSEPPPRGGCVACCTSVHRHRRFGVHVGQRASAVGAARHRDGPPPRLLHHLPHPDSRPAEVGAVAALVEAAMATLLVAPKAAAQRV